MLEYLVDALLGFVFLCASILSISYFKPSKPLVSLLLTIIMPLIAAWHFNLGFALIVLGFSLQTSLGYDSSKLAFEQSAFARKYGNTCNSLGHILITSGLLFLIWTIFFG